MKKIFIILTLITATACDFGDLNVDPNNPSAKVVPLSMMLTSAQSSLAYNLGGRASWYTGMFTAHITGVNAQPQDFSNYNMTESDVDGLWRDLYATVMITNNQIIEKAATEGAPHYAGIAKILTAVSLGTATSFWGDLPYSDAFKGAAANLTPKYDTQEQIYSTIQTLLDQAIADLSVAVSLTPGSDDLIYDGNVSLWRKAAYSLKARYFMHTQKRSANAAANALSALAAGKAITSIAEQAQLTFGDTQTDAAPWYQLNQDRPDVRINSYFSGLLNSLSDPRRTRYIETRTAGPFVGPKFSSINSAVPIISYAEVKFIEAEALLRTGGAGAQAALQAGISASLLDVTGANDAAYVTVNGTLSGTTAQQLQTVLTQKYIAMFTQPESWTDYIRTGIPALTPTATAVKSEANPAGAIPRRLPYPISERLFNLANLPSQSPSLQTPKLWLDN